MKPNTGTPSDQGEDLEQEGTEDDRVESIEPVSNDPLYMTAGIDKIFVERWATMGSKDSTVENMRKPASRLEENAGKAGKLEKLKK